MMERLDGPKLWPLRAACMAEAPTSEIYATCNHASHPEWPMPSPAREGATLQEPAAGLHRRRDDVGLRFGATLLVLAGAISLGAWARDLGGRYGTPRFVRRLGSAFLAIPLIDGVLAVRSVSSPMATPTSPGVIRSVAPSLGLLACATLVMLLLTWHHHWNARRDASTRGPYR